MEKLENQTIIKNMKKRIDYLKNPRYKIIRPPIIFTDIDKKKVKKNQYIFNKKRL